LVSTPLNQLRDLELSEAIYLIFNPSTILAYRIEIKAMEVTISNAILAYLLALRDFPDRLSDREKESLKTVATDLDLTPELRKSHIEPALIQTIRGNLELDRSYQFYREKLDRLEAIPLDLLPEVGEIEGLKPSESFSISKGMPPSSKPSGYEKQLNNVVIAINQADKPEEMVKQLNSLDRLKQFLDREDRSQYD
jgi:hypothetical protein